MIPYGKQSIDQDDIDAVVEVLKSDFLTCGPKVDEFEQALAAYCGAEHAVAVSNGTAALHLAMLAAGIGPGDRVLTSTNTFLASANCAEFVGATVDFADIDPETLCLSVETLKAAWKEGVKAVVAVDFAGYPCVTKEMADFVHERGAILIEDACHAIGGGIDGHKVGGLPWVDMTTFSFHPVKTMTTGEGGAVLKNNAAYAEKVRSLRSHGMVRASEVGSQKSEIVRELSHVLNNLEEDPTSDLRPPVSGLEPWLYAMPELGFNYRITDIQCALGISQLKKLDTFVHRRQQIVDQYNEAFADLEHVKRPISASLSSTTQQPSNPATQQPNNQQPTTNNQEQSTKHQEPQASPAWHLYVLQIDFPGLGTTRSDFIQSLKDAGVGSQVHYIPVHLQPYYRKQFRYETGICPCAEAYYQTALSLPLFPAMSDEEVGRVVSAFRKTVKNR